MSSIRNEQIAGDSLSSSQTAHNAEYVRVRREDVKYLLAVYIDNGMAEAEDMEVIDRLADALDFDGDVQPDVRG